MIINANITLQHNCLQLLYRTATYNITEEFVLTQIAGNYLKGTRK